MAYDLEKDDALNLHANPQENENKKTKSLNEIMAKKQEESGSLNEKFQVWKSAREVENFEYCTLSEIAENIAERESDETIIEMRNSNEQFVETGDLEFKKQYDSLKPKLPLITITSNFDGRRDEGHLINYTGLEVIDADYSENIDLPLRVKSLRRELKDCPFTRLMFKSPRGEGYGIKIIVKVNLNEAIKKCNKELQVCNDPVRRKELIGTVKDFHNQAHSQIREYYNNKYGLVFDVGAKNLQGVCFESGDSDVYYNPNSSKFNVVWAKMEKKAQMINSFNAADYSVTSNDEILEAILKDFTKNCNGRNTATFTIALQAKYYNIGEGEILSFVMRKWGDSTFTEKEAIRAIRNGFKYAPYVQYVFNNNENIA